VGGGGGGGGGGGRRYAFSENLMGYKASTWWKKVWLVGTLTMLPLRKMRVGRSNVRYMQMLAKGEEEEGR